MKNKFVLLFFCLFFYQIPLGLVAKNRNLHNGALFNSQAYGNMCYLTAAVQALSHAQSFNVFLEQRKNTNSLNKIGAACSYLQLINELKKEPPQENPKVDPSDFVIKTVGKFWASKLGEMLMSFEFLGKFYDTIKSENKELTKELESICYVTKNNPIYYDCPNKCKENNFLVTQPCYQIGIDEDNKTFDLYEKLRNRSFGNRKKRDKCPCCNKEISEDSKLPQQFYNIYSGPSFGPLPQVLQIMINRQSPSLHSSKLIYSESLTITSKEFQTYDEKPTNYELVSLITHTGSLDSGHYMAYGKDPQTKKWYFYDSCFGDKFGGEEKSPFTDEGYKGVMMLFYVKKESEVKPNEDTLKLNALQQKLAHLSEEVTKLKSSLEQVATQLTNLGKSLTSLKGQL